MSYSGTNRIVSLVLIADFAENCEIISGCLGYPENTFIDVCHENIDNQNDELWSLVQLQIL